MNTLPYFELQKICRICLKNDLLVSIYRPTYLMAPTPTPPPVIMIEKLNIFKPSDKLPTFVCQSCLYRLLDAYNLQQLAVASAERLSEFLLKSQPTAAKCDSDEILDDAQIFTSPFKYTTHPAATANTSNIYSNLCDINDIEIDVSSLTRSEAEDDSLNDVVFFKPHNLGADVRHAKNNVEVNAGSEQAADALSNPRSKRAKQCVPKICLDCGKSFKYQSSLEIHKRVHSAEKPFACKICERRFKQKCNLLIHQQIHSPTSNTTNEDPHKARRRFQCELCAAFFRTSSNLRAHQLTHSESCDYQCAQCERRFKTARELRRHQPIHKTIKDICCAMCDKRFTKQSYLTTHMTIVHRGIKRYKCAECNKVFGSQANLRCHMRIHTGEKPFECKQCNWKFNQSSALRRHMKKHCGGDALGSVTTKLNMDMPNEVLPAATLATFTPLSQLSNMNGLSMSGDELVEVGLSANESTSAFDFSKENILNFSTNTPQRTTDEGAQHPATHY